MGCEVSNVDVLVCVVCVFVVAGEERKWVVVERGKLKWSLGCGA